MKIEHIGVIVQKGTSHQTTEVVPYYELAVLAHIHNTSGPGGTIMENSFQDPKVTPRIVEPTREDDYIDEDTGSKKFTVSILSPQELYANLLAKYTHFSGFIREKWADAEEFEMELDKHAEKLAFREKKKTKQAEAA